MPAKFWSDEPEDTRSIEEIMANPAPVADPEEILVTPLNRFIGMKVKCSSLCNKDDKFATYTDPSMRGIIVKIGHDDAKDLVRVKMDGGDEWWYRAGKIIGRYGPENYDLAVAED